MSRSYKKFPCLKYAGDRKFKKLFNRRLRRIKKDIPNGNSYRKMNNTWEIYDIRSYCPKDSYPFDDFNKWQQYYRRK